MSSAGLENGGGSDLAVAVHEFMVLEFADGIDATRQAFVMEALAAYFARCEGLRSADTYRDKGGRWVKHMVWESQEAIDASAGLEDDPAVAGLFECFEAETFAYACCERIEPGGGRRGTGVAAAA